MLLQVSLTFGSMIAVIVSWLFVQSLISRRRARRAIAALRKRTPENLPISDKAALESLPEPVRRYFGTVMRSGQRPVRFARVSHSGELRDYENDEWHELEASTFYAGAEPALVWDAVIRLPRRMWKTAQLFYARGYGRGMVRFLSGIRMMDSSGFETSVSLLFRYLAETVWFPTALLPGGNVQWYPLDENSAKAIIRDKDISAAAVFYFAASGEVERIETDDKYRDYKGSFIREHFTMHCADYEVHNNVRIPARVEFEWQRGSKGFCYIRLRVDEVDYEF